MIRKARPNDIPRLLALLRQVNRIHYEGRPDLFRPVEKYTPEELETLLQDPLAPILVHTDSEDRAEGYAFCRFVVPESEMMVPERALYIDDLCVDASLRGKGIGRALYRAVTDLARAEGCSRITLNVWQCNPEAAAFYACLGLMPYKTCLEQVL